MQDGKIRIDFRQYTFDMEFPVKAFLEGTYFSPVQETETLNFMHFHNSIELGYCHAGNGWLYVDGKKMPFSAGDVVMVKPYVTHYVKPAYDHGVKQQMFCEWLYFDMKILQTAFRSSVFYSMLSSLAEQKLSYMIVSPDYPRVAMHVRMVLDELRAKRSNFQSYILGIIFTLCIDLSRVTTEYSGEQSSSKIIVTVFPAVEYIHLHYMDEIDLQHLADLCYMSPTHFRRVFKAVMHTSPLEYIHHERIHAACRMLYSTNLSILEICYKIGYNTVSCFNRQFLKILGIQPMKWRQQAKGHGNGMPYADM